MCPGGRESRKAGLPYILGTRLTIHEGVVRPRWVLPALALAVAAGCGPSRPAEAPEPQPLADHPRCSLKLGTVGSAITCLGDGATVMLPMGAWRMEEPEAPAFVRASRGFFHVSLRHAPPDEKRYPPDEHLRGIYQGIAALKGAGVVGPARYESTARGRAVLQYEVSGLVEAGRPVRSIHTWTALRRPDGGYVDYHSSWTGPPEDPEIAPTGEQAPFDRRMVNYADLFFMLDDDGRAPDR